MSRYDATMATPGKLKKAEIKAEALALLSMGHTYHETGKALGVSPAALTHLKQKSLAKEIIEHIQTRYILRAAKLVVNNQLYKIKRANKILRDPVRYPSNKLGEYKTLLELADKAEYRLAQVIGISTSHAPSYVFNMLFAGDKTTEDTQELESVQSWLAYKRDQDVQEAEFSEVDATTDEEAT